MALDFLIGRGSTLGYCETLPVSNSSVYVILAELISMDGISVTMDDIEGGKLSTTFTPARPGTPKGERATLTLQFNPADTTGLIKLQTWLASGKPPTVAWKATWEDGSSSTFLGYIGGMSLKGIEQDGRITYDVPLRVTSYPTHAAAS